MIYEIRILRRPEELFSLQLLDHVGCSCSSENNIHSNCACGLSSPMRADKPI